MNGCGRIPENSSAVEEAGVVEEEEVSLDEAALSRISTLAVGSSRQEVLTALGEPQGKVNMGDTEILFYHGVELKIQQNKVVSLPGNLVEELQAGIEKRRSEAKAQAVQTAKKKVAVQGNQNIRNGGKEIDIQTLVGNGSVTIVDFYADWCGPCRQAEPYLKKMAEDPGVNLIQIDIVNWSSPVASQYKLRSIPNMRVFDAEGKQVGKETHSVSVIRKNVEKARR
jgi:thioredoxin 1